MAKKAKKLTKSGRKRTGTTVGSGKKRGVKRAGKRGVSKQAVTRARRTRPTERKNVRRQASSVPKPQEAGGPSIPLRDLIRGGLPHSKKAHGGIAGTDPTPWKARRRKSAHGLKGSATVYQAPQTRRERFGGLKWAIPAR